MFDQDQAGDVGDMNATSPTRLRAVTGGRASAPAEPDMRIRVPKDVRTKLKLIAHLRGLPEVEKVEQLDHHVTLHFKGQPDTAPMVRWMIENGIQIDEVRKGQDSLEDVFLSLVEKDNELR